MGTSKYYDCIRRCLHSCEVGMMGAIYGNCEAFCNARCYGERCYEGRC